MGQAIGHRMVLAGRQVVEADLVEEVGQRRGVGQPAAVGREAHRSRAKAATTAQAGVDLDQLAALRAGRQAQPVEVEMVVGHRQPAAIRRPVQQRVVARLGEQEALLRAQPGLGLQHDFMPHAGRIGDVGHLLAVGAPQRVLFAHAGSLRQVAHAAVLDRHREDIAPRTHHHALAGGRQPGRGQRLAGILPLRPGLRRDAGELDVEQPGNAAGQLDLLDPPADLVHQGGAVGVDAADIPLCFVRQLAQLLGGGVEGEQIGRPVGAVGDEDHLTAGPDRRDVAGIDMRDLLPGLAGHVHDPDRRRRAAAAEPPAAGAGVGRAIRAVGQPLAIRRPGALVGDRLHHLRLVAAVHADFVELVAAVVQHLARRREQHALAVGAPAIDDVGRGMPGQAPRLAAVQPDDVDVGVAVVAGRKRDAAAIRRKTRRELGCRVAGQAARMAAVAVRQPEVTGIDKGQVVVGQRGLAQHVGGLGHRLPGRNQPGQRHQGVESSHQGLRNMRCRPLEVPPATPDSRPGRRCGPKVSATALQPGWRLSRPLRLPAITSRPGMKIMAQMILSRCCLTQGTLPNR
mmetsp:Transcript_65226/g.154019  ORF Transcript_65226/g.154019 Transcript_65226/m.154019 type:complete len:570 (+) Transcript_65226:1680-3389(+)